MIESNAFLPVLTDYLESLPDTSLPVPSSGSHSLLGLVFRKPREPFGLKAIFSSSVSKNGEVYTPETSCVMKTSVHIKNLVIGFWNLGITAL